MDDTLKNTEKDYIPYSEEWEKETSKLDKKIIIGMLASKGTECLSLRDQVEEQNKMIARVSTSFNEMSAAHTAELNSIEEKAKMVFNQVEELAKRVAMFEKFLVEEQLGEEWSAYLFSKNDKSE